MKIKESSIVETSDFKVIIYPASQPISAKEAKEITEKLYDFLPQWNAHGTPLTASFKIVHNQFVVFAIDEEKVKVSGCALDSLNGIMREIDTVFNLGFFDRMKACYKENDKVKCLALIDFRKKIKSGEITTNIEVFDFSRDTYVSFLSDFLLPFNRSWAGMLL